MAGVADFLFNGTVPMAAPTGSSTSQQFPLWLQQAIYNSIASAQNVASSPYMPFPGPQVAQTPEATQKAWDLAQSSIGSYAPYMKQAGALTQAGGAAVTPDAIKGFLNPYEKYVSGALNRNLMDNLLPNIQDRFVSAGQSRSPQEGQITSNAIRGTQEAVGQAMAQNYAGALSALQADRSRQIGAGAQFGQLGSLMSQLGTADISRLSTVGQQQQAQSQANIDAAMKNFYEQRDWPYQQIGFLSNIIRGLPVQAAGNTSQTVGMTYPGTSGPSPWQALTGSYQQSQSGLGYRRGGRPKQKKDGALMRRAA